MLNKMQVLDKGFVKLLNISGPIRRIWEEDDEGNTYEKVFDADDRDPATTARISFNNLEADRTKEQDIKLYEYLIKHKHSTPIEMIELWFEMKLPIFLERQFVRHRTQTINEVSARYSILPDDWYIPNIVGSKPTLNKQGQGDSLPSGVQSMFKVDLEEQCRKSYEKYQFFLEEGVAPEHARLFLHVNHYTRLVRKMNLHNFMHFLSLRLDSHAQVEARQYAEAMYTLVEQFLPESMKLFKKYRTLDTVFIHKI